MHDARLLVHCDLLCMVCFIDVVCLFKKTISVKLSLSLPGLCKPLTNVKLPDLQAHGSSVG